MSIEQLPDIKRSHTSFTEYADKVWYDELVRMQNSSTWTDQPIFLNGSFQELYAISIIEQLRTKPYFQKFGGKVIDIIMTPTSEPYMFNLGLQINE